MSFDPTDANGMMGADMRSPDEAALDKAVEQSRESAAGASAQTGNQQDLESRIRELEQTIRNFHGKGGIKVSGNMISASSLLGTGGVQATGTVSGWLVIAGKLRDETLLTG